MSRDLQEMRQEPALWKRLAPAALVTAPWTWLVVWRPRYQDDGYPCALPWYRELGAPILGRYGLFALEVALWFIIFYVMLRGFTSMQKSRFRRPFRWRPIPPDRESLYSLAAPPRGG